VTFAREASRWGPRLFGWLKAACGAFSGHTSAPPAALQSSIRKLRNCSLRARVAQLAQRLGLDLTDALARDIELLADFLEGVVGVHVDAEAACAAPSLRAV